MLPGSYTPGPVIEATLHIYVNGVERPYVTASWEGNTTGGLPDSLVAAGDDIYSRTGSITWAPATAVEDTPFMPKGEHRWTPRYGDRVYIEAEVGGVRFPRFTGYLGASTYSLTSDQMTSHITDGLSAGLGQTVTIAPKTADARNYLRSSWVAYRAAEQAGFGVLPPVTEDTVIHDSYQLGLQPVAGALIVSGIEYGVSGMSAWSNVRHRPAESGQTREGRDIMVYSRAAAWNYQSSVSLTITGGITYTLTWDKPASTLRFDRNGSVVFEQVIADAPDEMPLAFKLNRKAHRIWTGFEESVLVEGQTAPTSAQVLEITGQRCMGVRVDYLTQWSESLERVAALRRLSPIIRRSALEQDRIPATRGYENVTAEKVISDWCAATLSAVWVDELGRLNMSARDRMLTGTPGVLDKVSEKVFSGSWSQARDGQYSGVKLLGASSNLTGNLVYQPPNTLEITPGEDTEIFYTLPDEVDVIGVKPWQAVIDARRGVDNRQAFAEDRQGSWWAISFENTSEPEGYRWTGSHPEHEQLKAQLELLGQRTLKMTFGVKQTFPSSIEKYYLVTPSIAAEPLRFAQRGVNMPIIRAERVVTWVDYEMALRLKPAGLLFSLECGWWLTREDATRVALSLAEELAVERVTFDAVQMLWDPRKQIGDSHVLVGQDGAGDRWECEYILTGYKESWEGDVPSCSYDLAAKRVRDVRDGKTYGDLSAAYSSYSQIPASASYEQVYQALPERV
ncbi:hypothetical protein [Rothia sp. P4278]|uniref:hypothetical protein n=1 Tax=Rothia sp. P4278 TaxID=3402658 RepID=UPI003AE66DAE